MNVRDAAFQVLSEAGGPLHCHEITRQILEKGLWTTLGKSPQATVEARLSVEIKEHGQASRFCRVAKRTFAINSAWDAHARGVDAGAAPTSTTRSLSFTDAAEQVLERFGNRTPMHYKQVTRKALDLGLLHTQGKTPDATMYAQVLTEVQRQTRRGEQPRFTRHGRGLVGLTRWMPQGLTAQIAAHNRDVRNRLYQSVLNMGPLEFEALVARLLTALGFESVTVTAASGDSGIDVRGTLVVGDVIRTRMAVQVKRWKGNVQRTVVQQVRGSLGAHEQGLIITTSDFSQGARTEAQRVDATPVGLMNGEQLVELLVENDIGVQRSSHDLLELGDAEA